MKPVLRIKCLEISRNKNEMKKFPAVSVEKQHQSSNLQVITTELQGYCPFSVHKCWLGDISVLSKVNVKGIRRSVRVSAIEVPIVQYYSRYSRNELEFVTFQFQTYQITGFNFFSVT